MHNLIFLVIVNLFINVGVSYSIPEGPFPDAAFDKNIKTISFYKAGWEFSYPILELGETNHLLLSFDLLGKQYRNLMYSIIHCNSDWTQSRLTFQEYMDGFFQNSLYDYKQSFSTYITYQHYEVKIPNENVALKISGNYVIMIYEDGNDNEPLLIKRFVVADPKVSIDALAKRPTLPKYKNQYQEVDFSILHPDYPIDNPYQTIKVAVLKNNQWKFSITNLKPLFIRDKELVYNYEDNNLFPGGNEYRSIDIKNLKYKEPNVQSIDFINNMYEIQLQIDKRRDILPYLTYEELNGKFLVQNQQGTDAKIDADYVKVKFRLQSYQPVTEGDVYVYGEFTDFNCYEDNKMTYNTEAQIYELDMLIKQGYYNYLYVLQPNKTDDVDETFFEGSFYETENDYVIYVYYRPFGERYDKLIGTSIINSIKIR